MWKQFTDLQADQLFDPMSGEFRCESMVNQIALFDPYPPITGALSGGRGRHAQEGLPVLFLAKFNEQMEKLYDLLRLVEDIK